MFFRSDPAIVADVDVRDAADSRDNALGILGTVDQHQDFHTLAARVVQQSDRVVHAADRGFNAGRRGHFQAFLNNRTVGGGIVADDDVIDAGVPRPFDRDLAVNQPFVDPEHFDHGTPPLFRERTVGLSPDV